MRYYQSSSFFSVIERKKRSEKPKVVILSPIWRALPVADFNEILYGRRGRRRNHLCHILWEHDLTGGRKLAFPIDFDCHRYNTYPINGDIRRISSSNLPRKQPKHWATFQWKSRDPRVSHFVTVHSYHRQTTATTTPDRLRQQQQQGHHHHHLLGTQSNRTKTTAYVERQKNPY